MRRGRRRPAIAPPALDDTQRALIARLEPTFEFWQTGAAYQAGRHQEPHDVRRAGGAQLAAVLPHEAHAAWTPPKNRPGAADTVIAGNAGRQKALIPLRMGRMAASPFAFLRGAAAVMAWDLSHTPVSGPQVIIDGDAHINNFGLFGTPQREIILDLNDFDEATNGPWEWDVKRLVASVNVAGRENGLTRKDRRRAVMRAALGYRWNIARLSNAGVLDVWARFTYAERKPTAVKVPSKAWAIIQKTADKARRTNNETLLPKVARRGHDGGWRFVEAPPILTRVNDATREQVVASLTEYAETLPAAYRYMVGRYAVADVAHRVVGVGSVGTRAYLLLMFGNGDHDPLFLQVKEATSSVLEDHLPKSRYHNPGERVVQGQRMMQAASDIYLGWSKGIQADRYFYWRQLRDMKASAVVEGMTAFGLGLYAKVCGWTLARAHARSGDVIALNEYLGTDDDFDTAIADFSARSADQNERDYQAFADAVQSGRIPAVQGV